LRRFIEPVEEVLGATTLGDDPLQFFTFGLLYATVRARNVTLDNGVVIHLLGSLKEVTELTTEFLIILDSLSKTSAQFGCQLGFGHFFGAPFFVAFFTPVFFTLVFGFVAAGSNSEACAALSASTRAAFSSSVTS